jgi:hypothetical protein
MTQGLNTTIVFIADPASDPTIKVDLKELLILYYTVCFRRHICKLGTVRFSWF